MVGAVQAEELPSQGFGVHLGVELLSSYRFANGLLEHPDEPLQGLDQVVPDGPLGVVELGGRRDEGAAARQARAGCPPQPTLEKTP